ncbi:hypothetical protein NEMBOFW57_006014 [Staphylotrichum longicolle]|uniref:Uncharacterized protein n=1 Tax=Staphylotrichum longicolle TaxID=669026 RepID=A0AAD4HWG8_9PEZI|nr:hypothetical protein NEMBOFW57_006014 [Staphylotrichum longicolle]
MSAAATAPPQGSQPVPALTEPSGSEPGTGNATPRAAVDGEEKKKKRSLFGFGKKKTEEPTKPPPKPASNASNAPTTTRSKPTSPILTDHGRFSPSSPGHSGFASSPRLASPAGSQIFERNVQESTNPIPTSPAIPSHIQTENYIPPVLDASSSAITDDHLNPDTVEIITHASHQPASVAVTAGLSSLPQSPHDATQQQQQSPQHQPSWADELAAFSAQRFPSAAAGDGASNYGSFDTTDVRRLSFISFADVVQAEQQQQHAFSGNSTSRESMHNMVAGLTSLSAASAAAAARSSSPMRSPVSSSPPTSSKDGSVRGLEISVGGGGGGAKKPLGSPTSLGGHGLPPPLSPVGGGGWRWVGDCDRDDEAGVEADGERGSEWRRCWGEAG